MGPALPADAAPRPPHLGGNARVLVRFADDASRAAAIRRHAAVAEGPIGATGYELMLVPSSAVAAFAREPGVLGAEPDARVSLRFVPDDPYFQSDPFTLLGQWGLRRAQFDRAWDVQRGSPSVTVATIDTGVDPTHPDLAGALVDAPRYVSAPDPSCPVDATNRDDNGHGTHVAGVVGARGGNGVGIAGAAFGVRVMPIKALDCTGSGFVSDIARAITFASDAGARVISISLGSTQPSEVLEAAIRYAGAKDVVLVAAAGNCGAESGTSRCPTLNAPDYPAAYEGVLAVGATDPDDQPASFSTAAPYVALAAPGTRIVSTFPMYPVHLSSAQQTSYASLRGTSQAAPLVAAAAALVLSREPRLAAVKVIDRLRSSADDVSLPGYDERTGHGRLNAYRAVSAAPRYGARYELRSAPSALATASHSTLRAGITNLSTFVWPASGAKAVRPATHWYASDGTLVEWDGPRAAFAADVAIGETVAVDVPVAAPAPRGTYRLVVDLVEEGVSWFSAEGVEPISLPVVVRTGFGASYQPERPSLQVATGAAASLVVTVTNTGTAGWRAAGANAVRLASHLRDANGALVLWDGPRAPLPADVAPDARATITLPLPVPPRPGVYRLDLDLVQEGVAWFSGEGVTAHALALTAVSGYGARYDVAPPPPLLPGERIRLAVTLTNTGAFVWRVADEHPVRLAAHVFAADGALVRWDGERAALAADLAPNAVGRADLVIDAPLVAGTYRIRADLVREGLTWFSAQGAPWTELVLAVAAERRAAITFATPTVSRSSPQPIDVTVFNSGSAALSSEGLHPVKLASHWLDASGRALLWDGPRAPLPVVLRPGERATVRVPLAPPPQGAAVLVVDLVHEGFTWFGSGQASPVTVTP